MTFSATSRAKTDVAHRLASSVSIAVWRVQEVVSSGNVVPNRVVNVINLGECGSRCGSRWKRSADLPSHQIQ